MNKFYNFKFGPTNVNFLFITEYRYAIKGQVIKRITESPFILDIDNFKIDSITEITDPKEINRLNKLVTFK